MIIYDNSGVQLYDIDVEDSSYRYRVIMGRHDLTINVNYHEPLNLPIGCYTNFEGITYTLYRPEHVKKNGSRNLEYTITFHSSEFELSKYKLRNPVDKRLKFSFSGTPKEHLELIITNLNQRGSGWTLGTYPTASPKLINYNHTSLSDALRLLATDFETEYEVVEKVLNLGKVEYNKTEPLELSYANGFKAGISRQNTDSTKPIEILYVQGGEQNIDSSTYGGRELLLPKNQTLTYEGRQYVVDSEGMSIRRADKALSTHEEDSLDLSNIYPKREGAVSSVVVVDASDNFYDIIDSSIPDALDYSEQLIAGEQMTIVFQSGMLAGREFDVNYKHDTRKFVIVPQEYDGITMPGGYYLPAEGDTYIVFGCTLPSTYICDNTTQSGASWDMFREAVKYLYENEDPRYSFLGELDGIWSKSRWLEIGGKIKPGGYALYQDNDIVPEGILIRVTAVKDFVNNPHKPTIELSNTTISSGVMDQIKKPDQGEVIIDDKHKQGLNFTKRRFRDAQETIAMLSDAVEGFDSSIDPIAVQTMAMLVGSYNLQFRFVNSKTNPSVITPNIVYNNTTKVLTVPAGIIQHMTLGVTSISPTHEASEYKFWDIPSYTSPALVERDKSYYLYAWVAKSSNYGALLLKETAMPFNSGDFYFLLVGTLGKEFNGTRSYTSVYGFTEILPGSITTDLIKSPTGQTYINLSAGNGAGEIGGIIKFLAGSTGLSNLSEWQALAQDVSTALADSEYASDTASALEYLKTAILDGSTTIAGGLILANLLMLRGSDNVVRAGLSGLKDDNVFLFADPSNAYAKALAGTAMFVLRKDGTSKLGIMKVDTENVGLYKNGVEQIQFRTGPVPTRDDLVSQIDQTVVVPGGTDTRAQSYSGNFGNSNSIVTSSPLTSFSLSFSGSLSLGIYNHYTTPIIDSQVSCNYILERYEGGAWVYDRIIASESLSSELEGSSSQTFNVSSTINLSAGSYRLRIEYQINTNSVNDTCTVTATCTMHAQGAQANKAIIFGENGLIRIKDGNNYSLFSDEALEHKFGADKYLLLNEDGCKIRGGFDVPGLKGSGSVTSGGSLNNTFGKVNNANRNSTGIYTVSHDLGSSEFSVHLTPYNSSGQVSAVVSSKSFNAFTVRIVNPSNNSLMDSSFDFSIYATN